MKLTEVLNHLKSPDGRQLMANLAVQLISATLSIFAYYFLGGLFPAIITELVTLSSLMLALKLSNFKIEPLQYVALFFLTVLGLPGILMNDPFLAKIQEPISGLCMGLGFAAISLWKKESVIKTVTPKFLQNIPYFHQHLFSKSESAWKKIDYLWAVEMTLSAALSMACVFLFSTDIWFIAKYTIGPVLSCISFGITGLILYNDTQSTPLIPPVTRSTDLLLSPEPPETEPRSSVHFVFTPIDQPLDQPLDDNQTNLNTNSLSRPESTI